MNEQRAIDARVASEVMGLSLQVTTEGHPYFVDGTVLRVPIPHYSTDISAAWLVIEALAKSPHWIGVIVGTFGIPHAKCYRDSKLVSEEWIDLIDVPDPRSLSERCALAICLAALKAVEETQEGAS